LSIGAGVGVLMAVVLAQLARGFLYGVSPLDPIAYLAILIVLASAGIAATYVPSRRAALIDPAATLRDEA